MNKKYIALFLLVSCQQTFSVGFLGKLVTTTGLATLGYGTSILVRSDFQPTLNQTQRLLRSDKDVSLALMIRHLKNIQRPQADEAADYLKQFQSSTIDIVQDKLNEGIDTLKKSTEKK
jgi:hypothetical protein